MGVVLLESSNHLAEQGSWLDQQTGALWFNGRLRCHGQSNCEYGSHLATLWPPYTGTTCRHMRMFTFVYTELTYASMFLALGGQVCLPDILLDIFCNHVFFTRELWLGGSHLTVHLKNLNQPALHHLFASTKAVCSQGPKSSARACLKPSALVTIGPHYLVSTNSSPPLNSSVLPCFQDTFQSNLTVFPSSHRIIVIKI